MRRTFIAIALTALAFIPSAQAAQTVEADNGAVYEIARILPTGFGSVQVLVIPPGAPGDLVTPMQIQFDCHGHIRTYGGALEYVPPRSVASGIEKIACTGIKPPAPIKAESYVDGKYYDRVTPWGWHSPDQK